MDNVRTRNAVMDSERAVEKTALSLIQQAGDAVATTYGGAAGHIVAKGVNSGINFLYNKFR